MTQLYELYGMPRMVYQEKPSDTKWKDFFGVELEVENSTFRENFDMWITHIDGSLRDGTEFVLSTPLGGQALEKAIDAFYSKDMTYTSGPRTSTHIHVNMRDSSVDTLRTMSVIMYMLEDAIFNSVGESRKWSGYSVGLNEMEQRRLRIMLSSNDHRALHGAIAPSRNQERYYGFNTAAFRKHGTVEFRYFPGGPTKAELCNWIDLVAFVKAIGKRYTPEELTYQISDEASLRAFLETHFNLYWSQEFLRHDTLQALMDKFNVVSALGHEPDDMARRDDVVFINPVFLSFIIKNILKEDGAKYLEPIAKKLVATSLGEWNYYLEEAQGRDSRHRSHKKSTLRVQEDAVAEDPFNGEWAEPEYGEELIPPPAQPPRPPDLDEELRSLHNILNAGHRQAAAVGRYGGYVAQPRPQAVEAAIDVGQNAANLLERHRAELRAQLEAANRRAALRQRGLRNL